VKAFEESDSTTTKSDREGILHPDIAQLRSAREKLPHCGIYSNAVEKVEKARTCKQDKGFIRFITFYHGNALFSSIGFYHFKSNSLF